MADSTTPTSQRPRVGKVRSDQDHADLLSYHMTELRLKEAAVETAKGPVTEAKAKLSDKQEELTQAFNAAKADLGRHYSREYLGLLLKDGHQKITTLVEIEKIRARDKLALNQPVFGQQAELFPGDETPTAAKDEMAYEAEGFLRGRRGDLKELQDGDPPAFHQAIMRGYEQGQKLTREQVQRGMELRKRESEPDTSGAAPDLNAKQDPEPGSPEAQAAERKSVRRARESLDAMGGDKAKGEGFEASEEELQKQTPRQANAARKEAAVH